MATLGVGLKQEQRQSQRLQGCGDSPGCLTVPQSHGSDATLQLFAQSLVFREYQDDCTSSLSLSSALQ